MSAEGLAAGEEVGVEADPESAVSAESWRGGECLLVEKDDEVCGVGVGFPLCDVCLQKTDSNNVISAVIIAFVTITVVNMNT